MKIEHYLNNMLEKITEINIKLENVKINKMEKNRISE